MEYLFFVLFLYTFRKIVIELILILILACILVFISNNIILIGVGILVTIGILVGIRFFTDYLKILFFNCQSINNRLSKFATSRVST